MLATAAASVQTSDYMFWLWCVLFLSSATTILNNLLFLSFFLLLGIDKQLLVERRDPEAELCRHCSASSTFSSSLQVAQLLRTRKTQPTGHVQTCLLMWPPMAPIWYNIKKTNKKKQKFSRRTACVYVTVVGLVNLDLCGSFLFNYLTKKSQSLLSLYSPLPSFHIFAVDLSLCHLKFKKKMLLQ